MTIPPKRSVVFAIVCAVPDKTWAQGGHLGEGAPPWFFVGILTVAVLTLSIVIAIALWIARRAQCRSVPLLKPALGGVLVAVPLAAMAVIAMLALDAFWPGILVSVAGVGGYVATVLRWWQRRD